MGITCVGCMHDLNAHCLIGRSARLPPMSPTESRSSPETPVTPGTDTGPTRTRRRRSSAGSKECIPCKKTLYRKAEYDRHMKYATVHQQGRQFKCKHCGDEFTRADARGRHEKMCPSNPDSEGSQKGKGKGRDGSSD